MRDVQVMALAEFCSLLCTIIDIYLLDKWSDLAYYSMTSQQNAEARFVHAHAVVHSCCIHLSPSLTSPCFFSHFLLMFNCCALCRPKCSSSLNSPTYLIFLALSVQSQATVVLRLLRSMVPMSVRRNRCVHHIIFPSRLNIHSSYVITMLSLIKFARLAIAE